MQAVLFPQVRPRTSAAVRALSSSSTPFTTPVQLPFELARQPDSSAAGLNDGGEALIIAHGLFGSARNWRSMSRVFSRALNLPVYALDMRNHGSAPHAEPHTSLAMAADLDLFFREQKLTKAHLLGHSMGAKSSMALALLPQLSSTLASLISVDMAPSSDIILPEFKRYAEAMSEVEGKGATSKTQADEILAQVEPDVAVRQFLMTNARLDSGKITFRLPLATLAHAIDTLGDFPFAQGESRWEGPTLFIRGIRADYIADRHLPNIKAFFPNSTLVEFDTGHWVQAEKPDEFKRAVIDFISAHR